MKIYLFIFLIYEKITNSAAHLRIEECKVDKTALLPHAVSKKDFHLVILVGQVSLVVTRNSSGTVNTGLLVEMVLGQFLLFTDILLSCVISCVKV